MKPFIAASLGVLLLSSGAAWAQNDEYPSYPVQQPAAADQAQAQPASATDQAGQPVQPPTAAPTEIPPPPPQALPPAPQQAAIPQDQAQDPNAQYPAQAQAAPQYPVQGAGGGYDPGYADQGGAVDSSGGQWMYTGQYGWLYMPYGSAYTSPIYAGSIPNQYAYYPGYGWRWLSAPWVVGWGAHPYFGRWGYSHFGWYRPSYYGRYGFRGYGVHSVYGGYRGGVYGGYRGGYGGYHGAVYGARPGGYGAYRGGVSNGGYRVGAPVGVRGGVTVGAPHASAGFHGSVSSGGGFHASGGGGFHGGGGGHGGHR